MSVFDRLDIAFFASENSLERSDDFFAVIWMKVLGNLLAHKFVVFVSEHTLDRGTRILNDTVLVKDSEEIRGVQREYVKRYIRLGT
jgi:hypothetical protein